MQFGSQAIPSTGTPRNAHILWENPRKTFTSYLTIFFVILAARFLPLLRWFFKIQYIVLGLEDPSLDFVEADVSIPCLVTVGFEIVGKLVFNKGLASSSRPRKYYTVPRETLDSLLEDAEQLFDFFLVEFQRIIFVENLFYTVAAFSTALTAYFLVLFLPLWGLAIIGTTCAYFTPLIYITNKDLIDAEIEDLNVLLNAQIQHLKETVSHRTTHAHDSLRKYVDDCQARVHDFVVAKTQALNKAAHSAHARRAAAAANAAATTKVDATPSTAKPPMAQVNGNATAQVGADRPTPVPAAEQVNDVKESAPVKEKDGESANTGVEKVAADFPAAPKQEPVNGNAEAVGSSEEKESEKQPLLA
ncbi:hypothetical protein KEM55_001823 [Ascosphaera atra]|nr:hypothetical protein KEM55_001823 [Ascosphaera atra]